MKEKESFDLLVVGAGPTGMACAIEAQRAGFKSVLVDKGCLVNSLYHYPANMTFFTTPELLEVGDIPFSSPNQKPRRDEALEYYRKVAQHYQLDIRQYQRVVGVFGSDGEFEVLVEDSALEQRRYRSRKLVIATGYYDLPNYMHVHGEDLAKVLHYYREPHPYYDRDVLVVGGKNSAAIAALELWRHGARVTLVHRGERMHANVKYWILPDIENRIKNGEVTAHFKSSVVEILSRSVVLETPKGRMEITNDFVFALTGYHPDFAFLESLGIVLVGDDRRPACDPETLESNVPGIYLAGVIVSGTRTSEIFIENGRFHGREIAKSLRQKLS